METEKQILVNAAEGLIRLKQKVKSLKTINRKLKLENAKLKSRLEGVQDVAELFERTD